MGEAQGRWARTLARAASRESLWALQQDRERKGQRFIWEALLWRGTEKRSNGRDAKIFENCKNEVDLYTYIKMSRKGSYDGTSPLKSKAGMYAKAINFLHILNVFG